jgi:micrococcal nuclease
MQYIYQATLERVVDGDTVDVVIDLGFSTFRRERIRLYGVDAP